MNYPFGAMICGKPVKKWGQSVRQGRLIAEIYKAYPQTMLHALAHDSFGHRSLYQEFYHEKDNTFPLGAVETHIASGSQLSLDLKADMIYELICGHRRDGEKVTWGGQLYTGRPRSMSYLSLDALRVIACEHLGVTVEQAKKMDVTFRPGVVPTKRGILFLAQFDLGKLRNKKPFGIEVSHAAGVRYYPQGSELSVLEHVAKYAI
jgi:hypothetical protein